MSDGLSQNSVFSIAQDNDRNMWFATYDGINRYDGYNFTLYRTEKILISHMRPERTKGYMLIHKVDYGHTMED